jgi:hypothetical protein
MKWMSNPLPSPALDPKNSQSLKSNSPQPEKSTRSVVYKLADLSPFQDDDAVTSRRVSIAAPVMGTVRMGSESLLGGMNSVHLGATIIKAPVYSSAKLDLFHPPP